MSESKEVMIIQLCDYMNIAKLYLKEKGQLDHFLICSLDWETIVKDEALKERINKTIHTQNLKQ